MIFYHNEISRSIDWDENTDSQNEEDRELLSAIKGKDKAVKIWEARVAANNDGAD